jgi:hypothetical protein
MTRVVWFGVDTFEASFWARMNPAFLEQVKRLKEEAKEANVPQPLEIEGLEFLVQAKGIAKYPYLLKHDYLHIRLSGRLMGICISIRGTSLGLAVHGHECLYALADQVAKSIGGVASAGFSRLDVAVDFQEFVPTVEDFDKFVCPANYRNMTLKGHRLETIHFGRDAVVMRIYNKTAELAVSGKEWFRELWTQSPAYDPQKDTWRAELQMRRDFLKEIGCEPPWEAFANLPRILATGLDWCSLRVPHGVTQTRWPVDPRWEELGKGASAGLPLPRVREEARLGKIEPLLAMTGGCVASIAARLGEQEFDQAWKRVGDMIAARLDESGTSFGALVEERRRRQV